MSNPKTPSNPTPQRKDPRETRIWNAQARWMLDQVEKLLDDPTTSAQGRKQRLQQAERLMEQVHVEHPTCFPRERIYLWETLSEAWFRQGNITRTEHSLRRMAALQPGCADAYLNLGYYLTEMGIRDKATQVYCEGLQVDPANQYIIYNLAELYQSAGGKQAALKLLDDAINESADPSVLQKAKGDLLWQWGHPGMAAACYELALPQLEGSDLAFILETLHNLAKCYQESGDVQSAIRVWQRKLRRKKHDTDALYNLTLLHYQREDWQQAIDYGTQLLTHDNPNDEVKLILRRSHRALGNTEPLKLPTRRQAAKDTPPPKRRRMSPLQRARWSDYHNDPERINRDREGFIQSLMAKGYSRKAAEEQVDNLW